MDGSGRCLDNIFIERLWRSLKYEAVYLRELTEGFEARRVIGEWIGFYNTERPHSALGATTPAGAYRGNPPGDMLDKLLSALPLNACAQTPQGATSATARSIQRVAGCMYDNREHTLNQPSGCPTNRGQLIGADENHLV